MPAVSAVASPETPLSNEALEELVARSKAGDSEALEAVVVALQHGLFRLALRMTACPEDAEDATQEVLVKVVTRLESFRGESSLRTWAFRIAVRHLLDRKKSRVEALALDFERFGTDLLDGLSAESDPDPVLAEEVKRGCTLAMLTCLDRDQRLAFVLSDVFDLSHEEAADLCSVSQQVYRQRLSRARRTLEAFTRSYCGLVAKEASCHCSHRVARAESLGRLHRETPRLMGLAAAPTAPTESAVEAATEEMEGLLTTARLFRQHPNYLAPSAIAERIKGAIQGGQALWAPTGPGLV